jgi:hypothetical protein
MRVEWRSVDRQIARAARPGRVPASVTETRLMAHEHRAGAERMPVGASRRWAGEPLPGGGLYEVAQHNQKRIHSAQPF